MQDKNLKESILQEKLYLRLQKFSPFFAYFMFFDTEPYLADRLFIKHKVRVWFEHEYTKEGFPYLAILCHVRKKDVPQFLAALEELKNSMMLCGHPNYEIEIKQIIEDMAKLKGDALKNENDTAKEAEQG